jgi:LmbE family N-acetylglucosaminyl deacetylase
MELSAVRRSESIAALAMLGVKQERRHYLDLPDGILGSRIDTIVGYLVRSVLDHGTQALVSLGEDGFDGHDDHIATHQASLIAQQQLKNCFSYDIDVYSLNKDHQGEIFVQSTPERKLGAIALHQTQMPFEYRGGEMNIKDVQHWRNFTSTYGNLIYKGETYDQLKAA